MTVLPPNERPALIRMIASLWAQIDYRAHGVRGCTAGHFEARACEPMHPCFGTLHVGPQQLTMRLIVQERGAVCWEAYRFTPWVGGASAASGALPETACKADVRTHAPAVPNCSAATPTAVPAGGAAAARRAASPQVWPHVEAQPAAHELDSAASVWDCNVERETECAGGVAEEPQFEAQPWHEPTDGSVDYSVDIEIEQLLALCP